MRNLIYRNIRTAQMLSQSMSPLIINILSLILVVDRAKVAGQFDPNTSRHQSADVLDFGQYADGWNFEVICVDIVLPASTLIIRPTSILIRSEYFMKLLLLNNNF